jgi:hypothetical protein
MRRLLQINTLSNEERQHCEFCSIRATHIFFDIINGTSENINYACEICMRRVENGEIEVQDCLNCRRMIVPNDRGRCLCARLGKEKQIQTESVGLLTDEEKCVLRKVRNIIYKMGNDLNSRNRRDLIDSLDRNEKGEKIDIYNFPNLQDIPLSLKSLDLAISIEITNRNTEKGLVQSLESSIKILKSVKEDQERDIGCLKEERQYLRDQLKKE